MVAHLPFFWCCASPLQDTHLHSFDGVHCVYSLYQCVYILHQSVYSLHQSLLLTLVFLLLLHSECVYSLPQSVYRLLPYFYCFYAANVSIAYIRASIAYSGRSTAFTQRLCLQLTLKCRLLTLVFLLLLHSECAYSLHQCVYSLHQSLLLILVFLWFLLHRLCLQSTLQCRLLTLVLLLPLHSECVYTLHWCAYSLH